MYDAYRNKSIKMRTSCKSLRSVGGLFLRNARRSAPTLARFTTLTTNIIQERLSDYPKVAFDSYFTGSLSRDDRANKIRLNSFALIFGNPLSLELDTEGTTVRSLTEAIQKQYNKVKSVQAISLDLIPYSDSTALNDLADHAFYLLVNEENLFLLRPHAQGQFNSSPVLAKRGSAFENEAMNAYLHRFYQSLNDADGKAIDKQTIFRKMIESLVDPLVKPSDESEAMIQQLMQAKQTLHKLEVAREQLMRSAQKRTKVKMFAGLIGIAAQFGYVAMGTYSIYSWDIVEPTVYFINLSVSLALALTFYKTMRPFDPSSFLEYWRQKEFHKLAAQSGFSEEQYNQLKRAVLAMEHIVHYSYSRYF